MSVVNISEREIQDAAITPVFKYETLEDITQSEIKGYPVMVEEELVELRVAGRESCVHVARANEAAEYKGNRRISFAEKYSEAYNAFKQGDPQRAMGTPLEVLQAFGVTPAQISLMRARKIYTIEALQDLEGQNLKSLGMEANDLKQAVRRYAADRADKSKLHDENERLREELAALKGAVPASPAGASLDAYGHLSDAELKDAIAEKVGARPQGNPKRETLVQLAAEAGV